MKTFILTFVLTGSFLSLEAQGTVKIFNVATSFLISTNSNFYLPGGSTPGLMSTVPNSYYFALLTDATAPTSSNPLTGGWSVAQSGGVDVIGSNYLVAGGLNGSGGTAGVSIDGWAPGTSEYIELVGWSANMGTSWEAIVAQLENGAWNNYGWFGISGIGSIASGGVGAPASPASSLFGGSGIASGFVLNGVGPIPEPGTTALAGLGSLCLLMLGRNRKPAKK